MLSQLKQIPSMRSHKSHYEKAIAQQSVSSANAANTIKNQANTAIMNASQHFKKVSYRYDYSYQLSTSQLLLKCW